MTCVDRNTRCLVGWNVTYECDHDTLQAVVDQAPAAPRCFSDGFSMFLTLVNAPGVHAVAPAKTQTYSEARDYAELRQ